MKRDGFTIIANAIDPALVVELRDDIFRLERELAAQPAANLFEGTRTVRIYNLLARGAIYQMIPVHERVLPIVEGVLDRGCLVSSLSSIAIDPDETAQPLHADDQLIPLPKPHVSIICNSMWALTDFTIENGATRMVPGSHRAERSPQPFGEPARRPDAGRQRPGVRRLDLARRRRESRDRATLGAGDELLRRLVAPAGEPAARHPDRGRTQLLAAATQAGRLRPVSQADRSHRQVQPGRSARRWPTSAGCRLRRQVS